MYIPLATEGYLKLFSWIKAKTTGVLEKEISPNNMTTGIRACLIPIKKSSIARGEQKLIMISSRLLPMMSDIVPVSKTTIIAAACRIESAPTAIHRLYPLILKYADKKAYTTEAVNDFIKSIPKKAKISVFPCFRVFAIDLLKSYFFDICRGIFHLLILIIK